MRWMMLLCALLSGFTVLAQDDAPVFDPLTVTVVREDTAESAPGTPCAGVRDVLVPAWLVADGCTVRTVRPDSPIPDEGTPLTLTLAELNGDTINFVSSGSVITEFPYAGENIGYSPTRAGSAALTLLSPQGDAVRVLIVDNAANSRSDLDVTAFDIQGDLVSASPDFTRLIFADGTLYDLRSGQVRPMLTSGVLRQDTVSWLGEDVIAIRVRETDGSIRFVTLRISPSG